MRPVRSCLWIWPCISDRVCSGLDYAHDLKDFYGNHLNIIHRDISPQNIFVTYDGLVKIIDFGIRVVELRPKFLDEALFNLAMVEVRPGRKAAGIKNLERAITINPKNKAAVAYLTSLKNNRC